MVQVILAIAAVFWSVDTWTTLVIDTIELTDIDTSGVESEAVTIRVDGHSNGLYNDLIMIINIYSVIFITRPRVRA